MHMWICVHMHMSFGCNSNTLLTILLIKYKFKNTNTSFRLQSSIDRSVWLQKGRHHAKSAGVHATCVPGHSLLPISSPFRHWPCPWETTSFYVQRCTRAYLMTNRTWINSVNKRRLRQRYWDSSFVDSDNVVTRFAKLSRLQNWMLIRTP